MNTALFYDPLFLQHDAGAFHPESPRRLQAIVRGLTESDLWSQIDHPTAVPATEAHIELVHTKAYFDFIRECSRRGSVQIDPDTHISAQSFEVALLAAGAAVQAVGGIMEGEFRNAFAAVRPPGHHATQDRAMGFCLFNSIAIAARYLVRQYHLKSVLIVDWDVHHGNGTQDIFYDDPSVIYVSLHKKNHYPGTGWEDETGSNAASDTIINVPLAPPLTTDVYEERFKRALDRASRFEPQFILISCGFDAHERDALGNLGLKSETYGRLTTMVMDFALQFGHERVFSILEGGYDDLALAESSAEHVGALLHYRVRVEAE